MKALNNIKFISEATTRFNCLLTAIENAETFEEAKKIGNKALGYIDCMIVYLNCMISKENNDFTQELDELIEDMMASIYQKVADKATETEQDHDTVHKLLIKRDECKSH